MRNRSQGAPALSVRQFADGHDHSKSKPGIDNKWEKSPKLRPLSKSSPRKKSSELSDKKRNEQIKGAVIKFVRASADAHSQK